MKLCEEVLREMVLLRERTPDISGSVACTVDGLIIACDSGGKANGNSEQTAALSAALLALSRRMTIMTCQGVLRPVWPPSQHGFTDLERRKAWPAWTSLSRR